MFDEEESQERIRHRDPSQRQEGNGEAANGITRTVGKMSAESKAQSTHEIQ
jgi:hypothetical protein